VVDVQRPGVSADASFGASKSAHTSRLVQEQSVAAAGAGIRERVDAIVAAESHCCAFLTMQVSAESDTVVLSIEAPEGGELVLAELVDAFAADSAAAA
jgi:hypothetical protein